MRAHSAGRRVAQGCMALMLLALAACGTLPKPAGGPAPTAATVKPPRNHPELPVLPPAGSGRGGYYKDDGPGENPPPGLIDVPDALARVETPLPRANRSYVVFGKTYTPISGNTPFTQRGIGSWYGKKFHGQRTSSGELYDMYKMTAAHPTLPIPSYARLTSLVSGKQVIVRINDRGPFHPSRVIDVSYTAALKLGLLDKGSHELQIDRLLPADIERLKSAERQAPAAVPMAAQVAAQAAPQFGPPAPAAAPAAAPAVASPLVVAPAVPELMYPPDPVAGGVGQLRPVAAAPAEAAPAETAVARNGFYIQLGAFSEAERAAAARARLEPYAASLGALEVVQAGALHRLYCGPFPSRQQATQAIEALPGELSLKPIIVQR
ncbi:rare lipoprotein A [Oxalobacteraceae bacterium GrIS 1.11]